MNIFDINKLVIIDGAYALDGGSIHLTCINDSGNQIVIYLDWSIESQDEEKCQLFFDGRDIPKRSKEEEKLLDLLLHASYKSDKPKSTDSINTNKSEADNRIIFDDGISNIYNGIDRGPNEALKAMVNELIKNVNSEDYVISVNDMKLEEVIKKLEDAYNISDWKNAAKQLNYISRINGKLTESQKKFCEVVEEGYIQYHMNKENDNY